MIVAHNNDYNIFKQLLESSVDHLQKDALVRNDYYLTRGGTCLEKDVYNILNVKAKDTVFENNIELVSGQKFPDIVAYVHQSKAYGLEIKTTKANKWKSVGSSIFEGTRVEHVENIHLLFGRLSNPIAFRCRKYDECLYDVAITHSPRYLIDMDIDIGESIFAKVGIKYNTLRKLSNPFEPIKEYLRSNLKEGEDLWWIDNSEENVRDVSVKLWSNLLPKEKDRLRLIALAYFPNLLGNDSKKYARLATWLVSRFGIVNHALRDTFSAGGKINFGTEEFPRIFEHIFKNLHVILTEVMSIENNDIKHYWDIDPKIIHNKQVLWKTLCLQQSKSTLSDNQYKIFDKFLQNTV
ncbi:MAG: hypothetical protein D3921_00105 [Candidatus Electrothrix sp. AW1]|nr:hypothetical protein [Candidatus Electrothrix sp. AX1]MCI5180934.1 hypothetical protein [Candidatus Electrothrix gigas]